MRRYYLTNTARAHGGVSAVNEFALERLVDSADSTSRSVAALGDELSFSWITAAGEPNAYRWPTSGYKAQLDVTAAGADLTYGFSNIVPLGVSGWFERVNSADVQQDAAEQSEAAFTGTGLKSASAILNASTPARSDKHAIVLNVRNAHAINAQTITLRFGSDAWAEGPWLSRQAYAPQMLMGVGY